MYDKIGVMSDCYLWKVGSAEEIYLNSRNRDWLEKTLGEVSMIPVEVICHKQ